VDKAFS
jgi:hypothetical protein